MFQFGSLYSDRCDDIAVYVESTIGESCEDNESIVCQGMRLIEPYTGDICNYEASSLVNG